MASRNPEDLTIPCLTHYLLFKKAMAQAGIDFILTCTSRTQEEQDALYAQGRTRPGKIVTWTRNSKHIAGKAFDIAILVKGKLCWNPALDADGDGVPEYTEAGKIGEAVGLIWGGRFKGRNGKPMPDAPHFEIA